MRLHLRSLVSIVNSSDLPESEAIDKEIQIANPRATLLQLRAVAAVQFRLNIYAFSLFYCGRKPTVNLSDEKKLLVDCGLEEGDLIILFSKQSRPENGCMDIDEAGFGSSLPDPVPRLKEARLESKGSVLSVGDTIDVAALSRSIDRQSETLVELPGQGKLLVGGNKSNEISDVDSVNQNDSFPNESGSDMDKNGARELYSRLLEVTPNLIEMRENFLADPRAVLERVKLEDPTLSNLIAENQEEFLSLINNPVLVQTLQAEKEAQENGIFLDDEELEEIPEALMNLLDQGAFQEDEEGSLEQDNLDSREWDKEGILAYAPSEDDEKKIQQLVLLGFSYDQSKLAFYRCLRSLDRAANMLFENPPQL